MAEKRLRKPGKKDTPAKKRLALEITEREWDVSWWVKVITPLLTPIVLLLSVVVSAWWYTNQLNLQREHQRQETITNLRRELASENLRIAAARALDDYPKEAIQVLIHSLGDENEAFTDAVKTSLRQIGKEAIIPLVGELRRLQNEVIVIFAPLVRKRIPELERVPLLESGITWSVPRYFSLDTLLNKSFKDIRNELKDVFPEATDEEIDLVITKLQDKRSRPQLKVAHKNAVEILAELLCRHHIERGQLWGLDLSGAFLPGANLLDASLHYTNLSGANLIDANLSSAILVGANLSDANLLRANLAGADLAYAKLSGAYLPDVDLTGVKGFRDIENFSGADLRGVKGLSKEDLEHAKNNRAITD